MKRIVIGIRREDKNIWEKRVPLVPDDVSHLIDKENIDIIVQPSLGHRAFPDDEYERKGAIIQEDLSDCSVIFGVKEIPKEKFIDRKAYVFFSHVIKGQTYNMPMLEELLRKRCSLLDYEKIEDQNHRRLIFFGRYAGLAGMVESMRALGKRLQAKGIKNPFSDIKQPYKYSGLDDIKKSISEVGKKIEMDGLPKEIVPFVCGFSGYGHVSQGAQEIFDLLPVREVDPENIRNGITHLSIDNKIVYKTVFYEKNMFILQKHDGVFNLQDYFSNPSSYRSNFDDFIPSLTMLINCIYWTNDCPRLLTKEKLKTLFEESDDVKLQVVGDISCDIEGSVEITVESTSLGKPFFLYDPLSDTVREDPGGKGVVVMAIENLPCEIPVEASKDFSRVLTRFVPLIAKADFSRHYRDLDFPFELKNALIVLNGMLTPPYKYLERFLTG